MKTGVIKVSVVACLLLIAAFGCNNKENRNEVGVPGNNNGGKNAPTSNSPERNYSVIEEEANEALNKCTLSVRLYKRVKENELEEIANKLRASRQSYSKLWIFYYLPESVKGSPWATTHFTPKLEIVILGATDEQIKNSEIADKDEKIIGRWMDETAMPGPVSFVKHGNRIIVRRELSDGSRLDFEIRKKGNRYDYVEDVQGEYYKIESDGSLGMYNRQNKRFAVARKID